MACAGACVWGLWKSLGVPGDVMFFFLLLVGLGTFFSHLIKSDQNLIKSWFDQILIRFDQTQI